jgi:hypothetical protein
MPIYARCNPQEYVVFADELLLDRNAMTHEQQCHAFDELTCRLTNGSKPQPGCIDWRARGVPAYRLCMLEVMECYNALQLHGTATIADRRHMAFPRRFAFGGSDIIQQVCEAIVHHAGAVAAMLRAKWCFTGYHSP